jgi:predicted nucleic acid-binding Zn ribbon protein
VSRRNEGPTPIVHALERFLERSGISERVEEATVVPEWADRVGSRIAAVTRPLRVNRGTLFVAVRSSAWLMELKMMEGEILRRLNEDRERGRIKKIRFLMDEEPAGPGAG